MKYLFLLAIVVLLAVNVLAGLLTILSRRELIPIRFRRSLALSNPRAIGRTALLLGLLQFSWSASALLTLSCVLVLPTRIGDSIAGPGATSAMIAFVMWGIALICVSFGMGTFEAPHE